MMKADRTKDHLPFLFLESYFELHEFNNLRILETGRRRNDDWGLGSHEGSWSKGERGGKNGVLTERRKVER